MAGTNGTGLGLAKTGGIILLCIAAVMLLPSLWVWQQTGVWSPDTLHDKLPLVLPSDGPGIPREIARFFFDLPAALYPGAVGLILLWRASRARSRPMV
ncbi:hypothetical protein BH10PSE7_BH10PSE7_24320 [soil metagenome]